MALIVEDGTGILNADTWASMAVAKAYAASVGNTAFVDGDNEFLEPALRKAVYYLDAVYGSRYPGKRTYGPEEQSLSWPRDNVVHDDGYDQPADEIPVNLIRAQVEAAFREFAVPGSLAPVVGRSKKSVTIGPISVTYDDMAKASVWTNGYATVPVIDGLMFPLLDRDKTSSVAFLLRA